MVKKITKSFELIIPASLDVPVDATEEFKELAGCLAEALVTEVAIIPNDSMTNYVIRISGLVEVYE